MKFLKFVVTNSENISEWSGKLASYITLALIVTITYDVFLRYVFNAPTKWSYDITYMLGGTLILVPMAYVLRHRGHVSIDILRKKFPADTAVLVDTIFSLVFFFPLIGIIFYMSVKHAWTSWAMHELSNVGFWRPILYPFKTMIPVAFLFLLLQGIATLIRNVHSLTHGRREP